MEVQVDFSDIHDISLIYFGLKQQQYLQQKHMMKIFLHGCLCLVHCELPLGDEKTGPPQLGQPQGYFPGEK